jgi:DNA (cytosine-5)-methyltransferase 1
MMVRELFRPDTVAGRYLVALAKGPRLELEPHPNAPDQTDLLAVRRWIRSDRRPTAIDLFSGAGGLSLGLHDAGFRVLVAADSDANAIRTHRHNLGGLGYEGNLADPTDFLEHLDAWGVNRVDLIAGGVPCQPFSNAGMSKIRSLVNAGKRPAKDPRADLWQSFIAIVRALRPRGVLLENVPGLAEWDDGSVLLGFHEDLEALGYKVDAAVLEAHRYRVPQHRSRLFIVGIRGGRSFEWPSPHVWSSPTIRQAIGDMPRIDGGHRADRWPYAPSPRPSRLAARLRRDVPASERVWIHDHISRAVRADDLEAFQLMQEGDTYADLPERLRRYRADIFTDKYNRLSWDDLSRTITAHIARDGYWYIHPDQHRTLSIREAARIQTFPDWFRFAGEPSHRFRLIGNAVPPLLAEAIGRQLYRAIKSLGRARSAPIRKFRDGLSRWHRSNAQQYPWRNRTSPWDALMAEMCLNRMRPDQVAEVFKELRKLAPTPKALTADPAASLRSMRSLGIGQVADDIRAVARVLVKSHGGRVPNKKMELLALPGVGAYVANAVLTFGFGQRTILMGTNATRIVKRYTGRQSARTWQLRVDLNRLAGPAGPDAEFNSALIDFGAMVCRVGKPACDSCPLRKTCAHALVRSGA